MPINFPLFHTNSLQKPPTFFPINHKVRNPLTNIAIIAQELSEKEKGRENGAKTILEQVVRVDVNLCKILHPYDELLNELPIIKRLMEKN